MGSSTPSWAQKFKLWEEVPKSQQKLSAIHLDKLKKLMHVEKSFNATEFDRIQVACFDISVESGLEQNP